MQETSLMQDRTYERHAQHRKQNHTHYRVYLLSNWAIKTNTKKKEKIKCRQKHVRKAGQGITLICKPDAVRMKIMYSPESPVSPSSN